MPYGVFMDESKHCVHKLDASGKKTGDPLGCHDTAQDAQIQVAALYASEGRSLGSSVKSLGKGRVGGYLVSFTDNTKRDLYGTYFTRNTEFFLELGWPVRGDRILMEHGFTGEMKVMPVGVFDFAEVRDAGLWVEGILHDHLKYKEYLQNLKNSGKIEISEDEMDRKAKIAEIAVRSVVDLGIMGWSSGTLDKRFKVSEDGEILEWPIVEGTLTASPAEPNGDTKVVAYRNAFQQLEELLSNREEVLDRSEEDEEAHADRRSKSTKKERTMPSIRKLRFKIPKVLRQLMPDNTEEEIAAVVQLVADEMGETVSDEDVSEIVADVEETIAEDVAGGEEETAMAMDEEDMDEEEVRTRRSVRRQEIVLRSIARASVRHFAAREAKASRRRRSYIDEELESHRRRVPADVEDDLPAYRTTPRISVGEMRRYGHLSAMDMANYFMQMRALLPLPLRHQMTPVSDDFVRHMAHKIEAEVNKVGFRDPADSVAMRSVMPYKADEIDATTITGQGADWVGVFQGTRLWEKVREQSEVFQTMSSRGMFMQEIPQGYGSVPIPLESSDPIAYSSPEAADLDATGRVEVTANVGFIGTSKVTLTPGMIKIAAATTDELEEDSVIPILPQMTAQMELKAVETLEQALINGDTTATINTNINLIDGTPGTGISRPYYMVVNGLRKYPLVTNTAAARSAGGALSIDDYRKTIGKFSSKVRNRLSELFFLIDSDTHNTSLALPEIATEDVRRTNATIESGRLLNIYGIDVLTSGFLELANNAGKIPAAGGTLGQILAIFPRYWAFGWKRQMITKTQEDILSGAVYVVTSMRFGFLPRGVDAAAITYNVGVNV